MAGEALKQLFKALINISLVKRLALFMVCVGAYSTIVAYFGRHLPYNDALVETDSALFVGVILSVLLVFRLNSAYERWWEASNLWGQLINEIRNASCKVDRVLQLDLRERERFAVLMVEFAYSLRDHLRQVTAESGAPSAVRATGGVVRKPMAVVHDVYAQLGRQLQAGKISVEMVELVDMHIKALADILGSCERISTSPITAAHKSLLAHMLLIYVALLPWSLAPGLGFFSVPVVVVGVYLVMGMEVVAAGNEHPFGTDDEDIPLDRLCKTVETSVFELLELSRPIEVVISPDDVVQWVVPDDLTDCLAIQEHGVATGGIGEPRPDVNGDGNANGNGTVASVYDDPLADLKP